MDAKGQKNLRGHDHNELVDSIISVMKALKNHVKDWLAEYRTKADLRGCRSCLKNILNGLSMSFVLFSRIFKVLVQRNMLVLCELSQCGSR